MTAAVIFISLQWCLPEASIATWTKKLDNVSCDDGDSCTKSDTCKQGQCEGISFTCHSNCESCNGTGCSLNAGYGYVAGKCTCKIGGTLPCQGVPTIPMKAKSYVRLILFNNSQTQYYMHSFLIGRKTGVPNYRKKPTQMGFENS